MGSLSLAFLMITCGMNVDSLSAELYVETGMALLEQGLHNGAVIEFERALEIYENSTGAHLGLGMAAAECGSWSTAEEKFLLCIELEPFNPLPALELSEMLSRIPERTPEAVMYADMALALAPLDGRCRLARAVALRHNGEYQAAGEDFSRIITENPEYLLEAELNMGEMLYENGELNRARSFLLPASEAGEPEASRLLCLIYLEQGDQLRARDSAVRYLRYSPAGYWADSASVIIESASFTGPPNTGLQ